MALNKVLIVDDSAADLMNLQNIVEGKGVRTVTATSGKEALEKARDESPDLIFLDIIMDNMDGYSACRELKAESRTKDIPVVFVTSKNQKADIMWAKKQGGRSLISKPYSESDILAELHA
jgi:twitching motility two-component system response regulator PilH